MIHFYAFCLTKYILEPFNFKWKNWCHNWLALEILFFIHCNIFDHSTRSIFHVKDWLPYQFFLVRSRPVSINLFTWQFFTPVLVYPFSEAAQQIWRSYNLIIKQLIALRQSIQQKLSALSSQMWLFGNIIIWLLYGYDCVTFFVTSLINSYLYWVTCFVLSSVHILWNSQR